MNLILTSSPHIHGKKSTRGIMLDVIISLLPALIAGTIIFGLKALLVVSVTVLAAVGSEALFNIIAKKEQTVGDFSAVVTGLLLGLNLPADAPLWTAVIGAVFSIVVVKCFFGGIGANFANPAICGRVFMLIAFSSLAKPSFPLGVDAVSSATYLSGGEYTTLELFLGNIGGAIGETSKLALIIGGIYLLVRRVISFHIPLVYVGSVYLFSFLFGGFDALAALKEILAGGLILGAFFMATDYVTSPHTKWGKVIFAAGAGLVTTLIRFYGNYPEGVSFAILLMNILTPYISSFTGRKLFGGKKYE